MNTLDDPPPGPEEMRDRLIRAGRVKHEISNCLMGLIGTAELLTDDLDATRKSKQRAGVILEQGRRIRELLVELGGLSIREDLD